MVVLVAVAVSVMAVVPSTNGVAAVDQQVDAIDHLRSVTGQEASDGSDLLRLGEPLSGDLRFQCVALRVVPKLLGERSHHHCGTDGVRGDSASGPFQSQHFGQADKAELGCAISEMSWQRYGRRLGGEAYHRAAALGEHHPTYVLADQECASEVDGHRQIPVVYS